MSHETILQFGSGRFLRAFADLFIHEAAEKGQDIGRIVMVQSTGDARAGQLAKQGGKYHVIVRGFQDGQVIDRVQECRSLSRALVASSQWEEIRTLARSPQLKFVLSNTTEAGYELNPTGDTPEAAPPASFPAKLTRILLDRFAARQPGLTIIPCELMEGNAEILRGIVTKIAAEWGAPSEALQWLTDECVWLHTLVDRIVSGTPAEHPILADDPMAIVAEPFAFFALQTHPKAYPFIDHPAIKRTDDVKPYFLRKVRILNAAHTALLIEATERGFAIVRDAVNDPDLNIWLQKLLFEEIVPTLGGRVEEGELFAQQTLDRFRNPFLDHKFADIKLHHESKMRIRLVPTRDEYTAKNGKAPPLLRAVIAKGFEQLGVKE